ncbi:amidase [Verticiella sediminum]|uniref:Amidase n=1 Tax=Verticiella sediminum TaxID=1247510 RepID=A0A556AQ86_9BURK|nr:amidase [Verticiella sediminum]TSH95050.1 amidase [Verticiella sediminum]
MSDTGETADLADAGVVELSRLLHAGEVSALDVAQACIERIEACDGGLNAMVRFDPQVGLAQARAADRRRAAGEAHPLLGIPYTAKDNIWVAGLGCTQGSLRFEHFRAPADAQAVAALRAAGAVFLGHTNCSEFACKGVTTNLLYGVTRNPWHPQLTPGGSSGGAASATAAGYAPLALATDAGGSTRRPAAHTGVVGFKPSAGLIPHALGHAEPVYGNSVIGQMTRSAADLRPVLRTLALDAPDDPQWRPHDVRERLAQTDAAPRLRIGYSPRLGLGHAVDPDVQQALERTAQALQALGHEVIACDPAWPADTSEEALMPLQWAGLAELHGPAWQAGEWTADPDIAAQIEKGLALAGSAVTAALRLREALHRSLSAYWTQVDVMLTPTTAATAWPWTQPGPATIEGRPASPRAHAVFTPLFNHVGVPALSLPCGLDAAGLPIGVQLVAPRFADAMLVALAETLEARLPRLPRPARPG